MSINRPLNIKAIIQSKSRFEPRAAQHGQSEFFIRRRNQGISARSPYRGSERPQALGTPLFFGMLRGVNFMVAYACCEPGRFIEEPDEDRALYQR